MAAKHYRIDDKKQQIVGDVSKLTDKEKEDIQFLVSIGYTFTNREKSTNRTNPNKGRNKAFYKDHLTEAQFKEFEKKIVNGGFMSAAKWANDLID